MAENNYSERIEKCRIDLKSIIDPLKALGDGGSLVGRMHRSNEIKTYEGLLEVFNKDMGVYQSTLKSMIDSYKALGDGGSLVGRMCRRNEAEVLGNLLETFESCFPEIKSN